LLGIRCVWSLVACCQAGNVLFTAESKEKKGSFSTGIWLIDQETRQNPSLTTPDPYNWIGCECTVFKYMLKLTKQDLEDCKCAQYAIRFYEARLELLDLHTRCADLVINHLQLCCATYLTADLSVWGFSGCLVYGRITRQYAATGIRINHQTLNNPDDGALWLTWLVFWTLPIVSGLKPTTECPSRRVESTDGEPLVSRLEIARYITTVDTGCW
jgi:hypothetical protein